MKTSSINRAALRAFAALLRRWFAMFAWLMRAQLSRAGVEHAEVRLRKLIVTRALAEIELPEPIPGARKSSGTQRITGDRSALALYLRLALPQRASLRERQKLLQHAYANLDEYVARLIRLIHRGARLTEYVPIAAAARLCASPALCVAHADTS